MWFYGGNKIFMDIIENIKVDKIYVNSLNDDSKLAKDIYKISPDTDKCIIPVDKKITVISEGNCSLELTRANIQNEKYISIDNETSIVSVLKYDKFSMLFTGDAGVCALNKLKSDLPQNITVLKVGHHGAKNVINKDIMNYLNPKISLISVGYNTYGHPNNSTLSLLSQSKLLRTDLNHSVKLVVTPKDYTVYTYDPDKMRYLQNKRIHH